jgi:hypothetical protein
MTDDRNLPIASAQAGYYGQLLERHGPGVEAVASGKQVYKDLRYEKLCRVFERDRECSLHDVGFGLGHLYEYMKRQFPEKAVRYSGSEVTPQFVEHCTRAYPESHFVGRDLADGPFEDRYDYLVFGGTFYHLADTPAPEFGDYVRRTLSSAFAMCNRGIAFNFITGYVDYRLDGLFYGEVPEVVDFVARDLSRFFGIDHAYPLYEYTVCVYRDQYIASLYPDEAFHKYYKHKSSHV